MHPEDLPQLHMMYICAIEFVGWPIQQGRIQSLERGVHFVEKVEEKKKEKQGGWRKQEYHYEVKST